MMDIKVVNEGSLVGFTPTTEAGKAWLSEHLPDGAPRLGDRWFCEPRFADAIINGMLLDDLIVEV